MALFWAKGYNSTSIADLLGRTGLNAGSLYHVFPGKQDILIAVLTAYRDGLYPILVDPAWQGVDDPIARIFALLARYRLALAETDCTYGCPIGSLALELHEADPAVLALLAENFSGWTGAIQRCLDAAAARLPDDVDRQGLAEFVLTAMEGGVMQARTHRDIACFDRAVAALRDHFVMLEERAGRTAPAGGEER